MYQIPYHAVENALRYHVNVGILSILKDTILAIDSGAGRTFLPAP